MYNNHWGNAGCSGGYHPPYPCGTAPGPRSYKCRCTQEPISCEPEDGYDVSCQFSSISFCLPGNLLLLQDILLR